MHSQHFEIVTSNSPEMSLSRRCGNDKDAFNANYGIVALVAGVH